MKREQTQPKSKKDSPPAVVVKDLYKSFGEQKVLQGVNLSVASGEILSVLGRSGTGKSVLLRLLIGLEKPESGSICVNGQEITGLPLDGLNEVRKKLGFLFQQAALYDSMTIEENVAFPLIRHSKLTPEERNDRARQLLSSVGLDSDLDKAPSEISGGMKKRVGLARALALDPEIVMFDEPTAGLDPISGAEIGELIQQLKKDRGITCIVVTHDINSARSISDRLVVLNEGKIVAEGPFETLKKSRDPFVSRFLKVAA
jgi:phospholipid/cholesterol/gamma-HCH transport system ATP-binding protein